MRSRHSPSDDAGVGEATEEKLEHITDEADRDGVGEVNAEELRKADNAEELQEIIDEVDRDVAGEVNEEDIEEMVDSQCSGVQGRQLGR